MQAIAALGHGSGGHAKHIKFEARYDSTIPEDVSFMKATPWGEFTMSIDNPPALAFFQDADGKWLFGKAFYVDFTAA